MKNTFRVVLFSGILFCFWFIFHNSFTDEVFRYFSILLSLSLLVIGILIFLENRHPAQTLTWLIVFGAFPIIGFIFYFLFGRNYRKERIFRKKYLLDKEAYLQVRAKSKTKSIAQRKLEETIHQSKLFHLAERIGNSPISFATETKILTNGDETYSHILEELAMAAHHIHIQYYIVRDDHIGREIKKMLIQKAKQGIKVRFLYDAVGSWELSNTYITDLKNAGVETVAFGPVHLPFLNNKFNFRNHRKIIVIDGSVGFMGGLNIGDEYLGRNEAFGFWRDTHLMAKGEAVQTMQLIFLQDWYYSTDHSFLTDEYLSPSMPHEHTHGGVQIIAGGPDNELAIIKSIFFCMITNAQKSVWIASPYFIPDEDIFQAMKIAALSGLDVRLLVPKNPDKRIVFHASRSYFPELLAAGVRIYEYKNGFMHSKLVIVDHEIASIGTANMDMRSFHLNFEVNAFLFQTRSTQRLVNDFLHDLHVSCELHLDDFSKRKIRYKIMESTCRLLSPLL